MATAPRPGATTDDDLPTFKIDWDGTSVVVDAKSIPFGAWAKIGREVRRYVRGEVNALEGLTDEERSVETTELEQFAQMPSIVWWCLRKQGLDVDLATVVDTLEIGAVSDLLAEDDSPEA